MDSNFLLNVLEKNERGKYFIAFNNQYDGIYKISQYFQYFSRKITFNVLNGYFLSAWKLNLLRNEKKKKCYNNFFSYFFSFFAESFLPRLYHDYHPILYINFP